MKAGFRFFALALGLILAAAGKASAQVDTAAVKAWLLEGDWRRGLSMSPDASVNAVTFDLQYHRLQTTWDKVFTFLKYSDLQSMAPGKYPIDGDNAYAMITEGPTKAQDAVKWESHRKYIDLHYVISGKETIGVASLDKGTVTEPYSDQNDIAHYSADGTYYTAGPETFFLFFPQDLHRPGIAVAGTPQDKKLVIKIKYAKDL